jgi:hypothetical protein
LRRLTAAREPRRDPFAGLVEPVAQSRALRLRRMFGCWAYYADERLVWVSAAGREPWHGILVPTDRDRHPALRGTLPALRVHPVLRKWLYLPVRHPEFESVADRLAELIADRDERVGVVPAERRPRRAGRAGKERFG